MKRFEITLAVYSDNVIGPDFHSQIVEAKNRSEANRMCRTLACEGNKIFARTDLTRQVA